MSPLEAAVARTLVYADLFDQALSTKELQTFLIGAAASRDALSRLQAESSATIWKVDRDVWVLAGREELYTRQQHYRLTSERKMRSARKAVWLFRFIPWVKLVCVTGSVAGGSPKADDDIDLLIVSARNRLWLCRFLLTGVLTLLGKRRKPADDPHRVNNKFCLNMWLSEDNLTSQVRDLYVANELSRMKVVFNRQQTYEAYIAANSWLEDYLPNFWQRFNRNRGRGTGKPLLILDYLLGQLNSTLGSWQLDRMRPITRETVVDGLLMFHPKDYRSDILQRYERGLHEYGLKA